MKSLPRINVPSDDDLPRDNYCVPRSLAALLGRPIRIIISLGQAEGWLAHNGRAQWTGGNPAPHWWTNGLAVNLAYRPSAQATILQFARTQGQTGKWLVLVAHGHHAVAVIDGVVHGVWEPRIRVSHVWQVTLGGGESR